MATRATRSRSTTKVRALPQTSGLIRWLPGHGQQGGRYDLSTRTIGGPREGHLHLDWVTCAARLSVARCAEIARLGRSFPAETPTVVGESLLSAHRVGHVHFVPGVAETAPIYNLLWDIAADAAERHYGLAISAITRTPHYVEYEAGYGHFHWHNDYSHESLESPRKLTVIIQLSESDEYEGGDLELFGTRPVAAPRDRGTIICFPSFVVHRVTPITAGVRRVVVAWIAGPRLA